MRTCRLLRLGQLRNGALEGCVVRDVGHLQQLVSAQAVEQVRLQVSEELLDQVGAQVPAEGLEFGLCVSEEC